MSRREAGLELIGDAWRGERSSQVLPPFHRAPLTATAAADRGPIPETAARSRISFCRRPIPSNQRRAPYRYRKVYPSVYWSFAATFLARWHSLGTTMPRPLCVHFHQVFLAPRLNRRASSLPSPAPAVTTAFVYTTTLGTRFAGLIKQRESNSAAQRIFSSISNSSSASTTKPEVANPRASPTSPPPKGCTVHNDMTNCLPTNETPLSDPICCDGGAFLKNRRSRCDFPTRFPFTSSGWPPLSAHRTGPRSVSSLWYGCAHWAEYSSTDSSKFQLGFSGVCICPPRFQLCGCCRCHPGRRRPQQA